MLGGRVRRRRSASSSTCCRQPSEDRAHVVTLFEWLPVGSLHVDMAFLADPLSITMCLFVTGVGALIHLYADRLHARRPEVLQVLPLPQPVRLLDADARARREPARHVPRLGGRRHLLVLPDLVLAHPGVGGDGRQEGVRHQPRRRLRVHAGDVPRLPGRRLAELRGDQPRGRGRHARAVDGDRDRRPAVPRRRRQERPAAAVLLAARRDGGPDAGVGADPRRHDGHRRRVPDGAREPGARRVAPTGCRR